MKPTQNNSSARRRLATALFCWLSLPLLAPNTHAALGDLAAQYSFAATTMVMSPTQPYMYATLPAQNSVAIINTNTLAVSTVFVGSGPSNIAFSPDGAKAFITNSGSSFVVVLDPQTQKIIRSLVLPQTPRDVVVGNANRLFVLGTDTIFQ